VSNETVTVKPNTMTYISCKIVSNDESRAHINTDMYYVKVLPSYANKGIHISEGIFDFNCTRIAILNTNYDPIIIPAYRKIAKVQTVTLISDTQIPRLNNISVDDSDLCKVVLDSNLEPNKQDEISKLIREYSDLFDCRKDTLGSTNKIEHKIVTKGDPLRQKAYPTSFYERREIQRQVSSMISQGLVKHSDSPWAFPVVLVKKKTGEYRFCVDYRRLNAVTESNCHVFQIFYLK